MKPAFLALTALMLLAGCRSHAPLPTVERLDIPRYMGTWYEIAHLPNRFQADCTADTQARYQQTGEQVEVLNRCRMKDGSVKAARGIAKVVPESGNAKLRVSFFRPFYGDYWVLGLGPEYEWVLVGEPSREYAWVLSRTPQLDEATVQAALAQAQGLGFNAKAFTRTRQTQPIE